MGALEQLEELAEVVSRMPVGEDAEAVDVAGRVNAVATKLQSYKRAILSEMPGPVDGELYRTAESNVASRSYNSAAIIHAFENRGWALRDLIRVRAVELKWRYSDLMRAYREAGVDSMTTQREIEDLGEIDGPHIGEVWETRRELKGRNV